jgi:hypothetical protein
VEALGAPAMEAAGAPGLEAAGACWARRFGCRYAATQPPPHPAPRPCAAAPTEASRRTRRLERAFCGPISQYPFPFCFRS